MTITGPGPSFKILQAGKKWRRHKYSKAELKLFRIWAVGWKRGKGGGEVKDKWKRRKRRGRRKKGRREEGAKKGRKEEEGRWKGGGREVEGRWKGGGRRELEERRWKKGGRREVEEKEE